MIQFLDPDFLIEEECPALDISMPRVYRRPSMPFLSATNRGGPANSFGGQRRRRPVAPLLQEARRTYLSADGIGFGKTYGQILSEFNPAIQWGLSCWEYLLTIEGCRFVPRRVYEKSTCHGDYRVFMESDFNSLAHRAFKECLIAYFVQSPRREFYFFLREEFWPRILENYRGLENPPNPNERSLTAYSYLRCAPYQFLNGYHHKRVYKAVKRLPPPLQKVVTLYHLHFYKEEAVLNEAGISLHAFRRRRAQALRRIAEKDRLSCALLTQIERY